MSDLSEVDWLTIRQFHAERERNPDLAPYVGPGDSLDRFLAGAIVTREQFIADDSLWVAKNIRPEQMRRLRWMLDNT
jgi:hypothetical protein